MDSVGNSYTIHGLINAHYWISWHTFSYDIHNIQGIISGTVLVVGGGGGGVEYIDLIMS